MSSSTCNHSSLLLLISLLLRPKCRDQRNNSTWWKSKSNLSYRRRVPLQLIRWSTSGKFRPALIKWKRLKVMMQQRHRMPISSALTSSRRLRPLLVKSMNGECHLLSSKSRSKRWKPSSLRFSLIKVRSARPHRNLSILNYRLWHSPAM